MLQTLAVLALASVAACAPGGGHRDHYKGWVRHDNHTFGLNDAAQARGKLYFGTAVDNYEFHENSSYYKQLNNTHDFGQIVASNLLKWETTEATRGVFNFTGGDEIANLAIANKQKTRCHTLVWHSQLPAWVSAGKFDNATLIAIMKNHITTQVGHFKGRCYAWDVVNEALNEDGTFRPSVFYDTIGPAFIPIAFATAAEADPSAKLYYNDYNLEWPSAKVTAAQNIVKLIKQYGAKIDGVGMQAHFQLDRVPSYDAQVAAIKGYAALGVDVAYTELDIRVPVPANNSIYSLQADAYYNSTAACLTVDKCVGITVWDWTDKYSWVPEVFAGFGDALPWDKNFVKKPAYSAILKAFQTFKP